MINRTKMPRQLRNKGGITSVISRKKYGIGSDIKDFVRDIIPNELADVAVKAAPFVAPFYPGYAAIARGLGRFDQRGSISDALKQGAATYGFGKVAGKLGGAEGSEMGNIFGRQKYSMEGFQEQGLGKLFKGDPKPPIDGKERGGLETVQKGVDFVKEKIPGLGKLPDDVAQKLLVGGITSGASVLYSYFTGEFEPQEPGETMGEYMARRNTRVKQQMRGYMDSYYTPLRNPQYAAMSDEEKNNFIDGIVGEQNDAMMATGGRVGYQVGGISSANTLAENIARNRAAQSAFRQAINPSQQKVLERLRATQQAPSALETLGNLYNKKGIEEAQSKFIDQAVASEPTLGKQLDKTKSLMSGSGILSDLRHKTAAAQLRDKLGGGITGQVAANVLGGIREIPQLLTGDFKGVGEDLKANFQGARDVPVGLTPQESYDYLIAQQQVDPGVAATPTPDAEIPGAMNSLINVNKPTMADIAGPATQDTIPGFTRVMANDAEQKPGSYNYVGPDGQIYGEETYASIAAGRYPDIYNPNSMMEFTGESFANVPISILNLLRTIPASDYNNMGPRRQEVEKIIQERTGKTAADFLSLKSGGRVGLMGGAMPTGIMRTNKAGVKERDYRDEGGFVPVGIKEKADDVPAMLSKNEFVFTADAVRGAGNGSIEKGAQKMYDTMKNLERRVV